MLKKIGLCLAIMMLACPAIAQENRPTPEQQQQMVQQQMQSMPPMFAQMVTSMMQASLDLLSKPESAEKLATFTKNYYDALIQKGFTKEEAMKIVISVGMPAMPSGQK